MEAGRTPFFSFLVPTRDRPELVGYCLQSLKRQDFPDFEAIVSDNHTARPCKTVFDTIADERFRYVAPPSPLTMADNWEFALQHAMGEYIGVLIDKTVLLPSTLRTVFETVRQEPAEIVSWWSESYYPREEKAGYDLGHYAPASWPNRPGRFDPAAELQRRFRFDVRRGREGKHYFRGKICFGVYRRDLIDRIRSGVGRLFLPLSPDYTSMTAALGLANSAVDLGRPFLLSFSSSLSTGASAAKDAAIARDFLAQIDPRLIHDLPLPGLYASHHNSVAYDYLQIQKKIGGRLGSLQLNRNNLILRAKEDLEQQQWSDPAEKCAQEAIVDAHLKTIPTGALARYRLARLGQEFSRFRQTIQLFPAVRRLLRPLGRRYPKFKTFAKALMRERELDAWEHREYFSSIIEAVDAADRYYDRQLDGQSDGKT